jgi:hypothetical protein
MISNLLTRISEFGERNFYQEEDRWVWPAIVIALMITAVIMVFLHSLIPNQDNQDKVNTGSVSVPVPQEQIQNNLVPQKVEQVTSNSSEEYKISLTKSRLSAKRFLKDYILFTYGKLEASKIHFASEDLINSLQSPRILNNQRNLKLKITVQVAEGGTETEIPFIASVDDGKLFYSMNIIAELINNKWLITKIVR